MVKLFFHPTLRLRKTGGAAKESGLPRITSEPAGCMTIYAPSLAVNFYFSLPPTERIPDQFRIFSRRFSLAGHLTPLFDGSADFTRMTPNMASAMTHTLLRWRLICVKAVSWPI
ncbi:hypothetical protein KL86DPRO_70117 [uncultured delta proteobacterium]|uniref:Uncharacterized protein n=1 Tax=uncultured delta proteobacterium TaxID=34034 RepID=A0A212KH70_9DELT|nr:hypothetical protein KL86DPRO_70117 [uncultured delta proteobacterium]